MAEGSRNVFRGNLEKGVEKQRGCCPVREDRKTVAGWIRKTREEAESEEERCGQNEYLLNDRQHRYVDVPNRELSAESFERRAICTKDLHASLGSSKFRACPRKDLLAKLAPTTDTAAINEVIQQVENEEITTAAEFIFGLTPYVRDKAVLFREVLEKELNYFREIVNDTVDRRVQDEADVMMHTQKRIKNKFKSRSHEMTQRTMRIRQRLHEISPKFNWAVDGRDKEKIAKLFDTPEPNKKNINEKENKSESIDKLTHRVFMRGQWLKKELTRLQDENNNLKKFLCKFRKLAAERKKQESYVPEMLSREKKELERELNELRKTYKTNLEIINALYIEHHRCIKPPSEHSVVD